ncbi:thermonuclease family protein [Nesterenkonia ebinurensis]|uniref:thermonuclease family protein n=1 Tax=Nesterenkonia ebinurensis TaxID=2608252 RepID=UPI00123E1D29|nr:thermonuclease family protein [Nesterenkonia ebinurensis]
MNTQSHTNRAVRRTTRRQARRNLGRTMNSPRGQNRQSLVQGLSMWLGVILLAILVAGALSWWQNRPPELPEGFSDDAAVAELVRIVDGDTIVVELDSGEQRVRLLNIDTPETVHPNQPVKCGGPEASAAIAELISPGDLVVLEFDMEIRDHYDRLLAGVFTEEVFINEELAAQGWAEPVYFAPNGRFLPVIEEAWAQAEADGVGLFSPDLGCRSGEPIGQ